MSCSFVRPIFYGLCLTIGLWNFIFGVLVHVGEMVGCIPNLGQFDLNVKNLVLLWTHDRNLNWLN